MYIINHEDHNILNCNNQPTLRLECKKEMKEGTMRNRVKTYIQYILILFSIIPFILNTSYGRESGFSLLEDVKYVRIPIEIQNNLILLPIKLNRNVEVNFILDTGVRTSILTEPVIASFLSLDTLETISIRGLGEGEAIQAGLARNITMELPGVIGKGINLVILPEGLVSYSGMFGKPVYGIIGFELFRSFVVEINYSRKFIKLYNPFKFKPRKRWQRMPIRLNRGKPYVIASVTPPEDSEITTSWLIDTGSSQALSMYYRGVNPPDPNIYTLLGQGLNGDIYGYLGRVDTFTIGQHYFEDVVTGFPEPEALGLSDNEFAWYGNIGSEVLSRFRVVFDYPRNRLYIKKSHGYKQPFSHNLSGIEMIATGVAYDEYQITYVRPTSSAAEAGLQSRDKVIKINGISHEDISIEEIYGIINRKEGKKISMIIERGGKTLKKQFVLVEEI